MTRPAMTGEVTSPVLPGDWVADPAACTLAFAVRKFGPPLGRRDRRAGLPHRSPDLALAGGSAPAAGRTAAAPTFSGMRSFICSPS
jgi:hypothetical protein